MPKITHPTMETVNRINRMRALFNRSVWCVLTDGRMFHVDGLSAIVYSGNGHVWTTRSLLYPMCKVAELEYVEW